MDHQTVLNVKGLTVKFFTRSGVVTAVDGVSFEVRTGQVMGLVGESGSGKTVTGFSLMGLIDSPGRITAGSAVFKTRSGRSIDLMRCQPHEWRAVRGSDIAMIFQDPMLTLNPVLRIDTQMAESLLAHESVSKQEARNRSLQALDSVGIAAPQERLHAYPHQLSGGMRQRVAIAIALLNRPSLIIADEPTTALDVTIQGQILHVMQELCRHSNTSLIWITHDLSVVAGLADTVSVMYGGQIVETGTVKQVLADPLHPYTQGLMTSVPSANLRGTPLKQIPGSIFSSARRPPGCLFEPRCAMSIPACRVPQVLFPSSDRAVRCIRPQGQLQAGSKGVEQ